MKKLNFDFIKNLPKVLIAYALIIVIGIVMMFINGVSVDIQFTGGAKITYSYEGEIDLAKVKEVAEKSLGEKVIITESESFTDESVKKIVVSVSGNQGVDAEQTDALLSALEKDFKDNKIKQAEVNTVSASIGNTFFLKCLVAVIIASILIIIYVSFRFKKIGGAVAAVTALIALVFDVLVAFFSCVIFSLDIDSNFMAVVLILLGYSINATIVIFDRIRENRRVLGNDAKVTDLVNLSNKQCFKRNVMTTVTTLAAIIIVLAVAELNGVNTMRSLTIPMIFGLLSGAFSSMCISPPLWAKWQKR